MVVRHLETLGESGGKLIAAPVDKLVSVISGENAPVIRPRAGEFAGDLLKTPFRIAGTLAWGAMKGSAKLAWAGIRNLPIFPAWKAERDDVMAQSTKKRDSLADSIQPGKETT